MDTTLELINETQGKLKELLDNYRNDTKSIATQNNDRVEELYNQILGYIAEKFEPYKEFYLRYHNKLHKVASVWISDSYSGDWIDIRANSDWTKFFFSPNQYGWEVSHKRIVLGWKRIKEDFLKDLEREKDDYLEDCDRNRNEAIELKAKLDAFEL